MAFLARFGHRDVVLRPRNGRMYLHFTAENIGFPYLQRELPAESGPK
jgi:hypothetical protein